MEAKDIRVGNLINSTISKYRSQPIEVKGVLKRGCIIDEELEIIIDFENLKPLKLTEEWFLKFWFEKHHADFYNNEIMLKSINNEWELYFYPVALGSAVSGRFKRIKYVHELQNLYFALSGKELTLN